MREELDNNIIDLHRYEGRIGQRLLSRIVKNNLVFGSGYNEPTIFVEIQKRS
jgi:hypothetical protein